MCPQLINQHKYAANWSCDEADLQVEMTITYYTWWCKTQNAYFNLLYSNVLEKETIGLNDWDFTVHTATYLRSYGQRAASFPSY